MNRQRLTLALGALLLTAHGGCLGDGDESLRPPPPLTDPPQAMPVGPDGDPLVRDGWSYEGTEVRQGGDGTAGGDLLPPPPADVGPEDILVPEDADTQPEDAPNPPEKTDAPAPEDTDDPPEDAGAPPEDAGPEPCLPSCGDKVCGPDGCGGSCGDCAVGTMCADGACVPNDTTWPNLAWNPGEPVSGVITQALVEDTSPWVYVGLHVTGPCGPVSTSLLGADEVSDGVWRWTFDVSPMAAGEHAVAFTRDNDQVVVLSATVDVSGDPTCLDAPPLCPTAGVPCEDHYEEVQVCAATGASVPVLCHKFGTCVAEGDGTQCGWGDGSWCEDPCGDAPAPTEDLCPDEGVPCADDYQTVKSCEASGQSVSVQCHKVGTCMGPGDGTQCSWGEGSWCEDPCAGVVTAQPPPDNRFGIGLVGPGDDNQLNLVKELTGAGGHALLIFPGVQVTTIGPDPSWVAAVQGVYARDLIPVIRLGPPWGEAEVRAQSDDPSHLSYEALADAYRAVVEGLPKKDGTPLYIQVHNEPNLCYEWECSGGGSIDSTTIAAEYASFLRDVADALHGIGDPRIQVSLGALAPGGNVSCECCAESWCGAQPGETGLDFMNKMQAAVPDIWSRLDYLASHAYPATNIGWGFFQPYPASAPGLAYFEQELALVGPALPVLITETGWSTQRPEGGPFPTSAEVATWTVQAYQEIWLTHPNIKGVMPFMLQDAFWGDQEGFGWVLTSGAKEPVFNAIRDLRCGLGLGPC